MMLLGILKRKLIRNIIRSKKVLDIGCGGFGGIYCLRFVLQISKNSGEL
jgi:2-polyprenyl-3-methyl-5-hydroxy-6-metoxy-1,4-benzoquinol methylase